MDAAIIEFLQRAASGSNAAYKPLLRAMTEDEGLTPQVAALLEHESGPARRGAANALGALAAAHPARVAPHAGALATLAQAEDARAREAALGALAALAAAAPDAVAPGIEALLGAFRGERKAALRAHAAMGLARAGLAPSLRPRVVPAFVQHLKANPRDKQARDILVAMSELTAHAHSMGDAERADLAGAVGRLRTHPNLQVRERAGRIWRDLNAHR